MADPNTICKFNQTGYCRYQSHCRKQHVMELCSNLECAMDSSCVKRHPRVCKYFSIFARCKFDDNCAYLHKNETKSLEKEIFKQKEKVEKEMKELKDEIEELQKQITELKVKLSVHDKTQYQTFTSQPNLLLPTNRTITLLNNSNDQVNSSETIPQLDGDALPPSLGVESSDSFYADSQYKCENCDKNFNSEEGLQNHRDNHEWGCDDCYLCLTSKYLADLHELEFHPDSMDYINNHIPDTTKKLFAAGHRQR